MPGIRLGTRRCPEVPVIVDLAEFTTGPIEMGRLG